MKETEEQKAWNKILSLVSHKMKTPLSIINGYSEAVLSQAGKERFSPFTTKALEEINKQGNKMSALVDKLMFYNKVSAMQPTDIKRAPITLKPLLKECASTAISREEEAGVVPPNSNANKRGTYIEIDCPDKFPLTGDEKLIKAMVDELLSNAIKFNNKLEKIIKIQCANHGDSISISVRDYGAGIRPQDVNKIFERFYQVDDYFTGQIDGWGLGLSLVKKIVELHAGSVSVVSDRGLGSIFTVNLPY